MGRSKEFDDSQALEAALRVFWRKGYEGTSIQDLVDATGVNRASLYETFGNKHDLFMKSIGRFSAEQSVDRATVGFPPGIARIRAALRWAADQTATDVRGCMIVNAIVELGAEDHEMRSLGRSAREHLESFFARSLADAESRGEVRPGRDRTALARLLTNTVFGLRVTAKTQPDQQIIRSIVDTTLSLVEDESPSSAVRSAKS
jgi:TetR/AcrR family transcriptional repressor of nem operon